MHQESVSVRRGLIARKPLGASQAKVAAEIERLLHSPEERDRATVIGVQGLSGAGKSYLMSSLRQSLSSRGIEVLDKPVYLGSRLAAANHSLKIVMPLLPCEGLGQYLPWDPAGHSKQSAHTLRMGGLSKDELTKLFGASLDKYADSALQLVAFSHGSAALMAALIRERANSPTLATFSKKAIPIVLGYLAAQIGTPPTDESYRKLCSEFSLHEFTLPVTESLDSFSLRNSATAYLAAARRTSARFATAECWDRYERIATFLEAHSARLVEPAITIFGVAPTEGAARKLVAILDDLSDERLDRSEGVYTRKTRVAIYTARTGEFKRGWSTADERDALRERRMQFAFAPSEPEAESFLEVHTHEHQFEPKFLQLSALAESRLREAGISYYWSVNAHNAHPIDLYYDAKKGTTTPITFATLRYSDRHSNPVRLYAESNDDDAWRNIHVALQAVLVGSPGVALLNADKLIPFVCSEYGRRKAPHLITELGVNLNRLSEESIRYLVTTTEDLLNGREMAEGFPMVDGKKALLVLGYGAYRTRNRQSEIQRAIDDFVARIPGGAELLLCSEGLDPEALLDDPWSKERLATPVLHNIEFQRGGVSVEAKSITVEAEGSERFVFWAQEGRTTVYLRTSR